MSTQRVVLNVEGMSCHHCVTAIEKALRVVSGVREVKVDLAAKQVEVVFVPESASVRDLAQAIVDAGYEVSGHCINL